MRSSPASKLTREQDPEKAVEIEAWLDCWAKFLHRKSYTLDEDAMIAAIAKVHGLTVVIRNGAASPRSASKC